MDRMTKDEFLATASSEAVAYLEAGRNVEVNGEYYTQENLGITPHNSLASAAGSAKENAALVKRNKELEEALAELRAKEKHVPKKES